VLSHRVSITSRHGSRARQFLDVGRDVNALDAGELRDTLPREPIETLEEALAKHGTPGIFNTDQGSQFTSEAFTSVAF
jgi:hypothetical protein